jgi:hypothetical protein
MDVSRRGPNLLLRVQYGEVPLYAAVAYDSHQDRDDAAQRLQGFTGSLRDVPLVVANVVNQPTPSVPSLRFMRAAELISGRDLLGPGGPNAVPRMEAPLLLDEEMRRRAALLEYVRNASDKTERLAYRLEEPTGYIYFGDEQDFESARVIGRPGSERLTHRPNSALFSAFHRLDLVQLARLRQGEQLGLVSVHGGRLNEPVLAELSSLKGQALAFNREQDRRIVSLKEDDLQASLEEALRRVRHDAQSLAAAVQIEGSVDPTERLRPRTTCVAVVVGERVPGVVWPMQATVLTLANEPAEDVALVRIVPAEWMEPLSSGSTWDDHARELAGWFDLELQPGWETIEGDGRQILAALLGHVESEIGFA